MQKICFLADFLIVVKIQRCVIVYCIEQTAMKEVVKHEEGNKSFKMEIYKISFYEDLIRSFLVYYTLNTIET